jgi:ribosomal RNA-processing protein 7
MAPVASKRIPTATGDFTILPLQITPVPAYPVATTHYLYIRSHEPKLPDARSPRSLFVVNVPIDATEYHIRSLFSRLGGGLVEDVTFETTRPSKSAMIKQAPVQASKKRKRLDEDELMMSLPAVWDREVQKSGSSAVVVFVDKPSMEATLKSVKKAAKARSELVWGEGVADKVESLGSSSTLWHL